MDVFARVAAIYNKIDPDDTSVVRNFNKTVFPALSPEKHQNNLYRSL
jgi:hypothetical protein